MGTILTEVNNWDTQIIVPNPGEPARAGNGTYAPITIAGADQNGGVTYSASSLNVTVRHLGGVAQVLAVSVVGHDITVQLGTDGGGAVTSSANAVVTAVGLSVAAMAWLSGGVSATGTGASMAGVAGVTALSAPTGGSVRPSLQSLANRSLYLKQLAESQAIYGRPRVDAYCTDGATITIVQASPIVSGPGVGYVYYTFGSVNFVPGGAANTWYYVYGDHNTLVQVSTTGPDSNRVFKTGDVTQRYLFCFRTIAGGVIQRGYWKNGRFRMSDPFTNNIAGGLAAPGPVVIDLSSYVPPTTQKAYLRATINNNDTVNTKAVAFRINGIGNYGENAIVVGVGTASGSGYASQTIEQTTDSAQKIQVTGDIDRFSGMGNGLFPAGWAEE